jgi:hypothetical protein
MIDDFCILLMMVRPARKIIKTIASKIKRGGSSKRQR